MKTAPKTVVTKKVGSRPRVTTKAQPFVAKKPPAVPVEAPKKLSSKSKAVPPPDVTVTKTVINPSVESKTRSTPKSKIEKKLATLPKAVGIFALSTEAGIFLVTATNQVDTPLLEFRMAEKDPFPRAINVGARKCLSASKVVIDSSVTPQRHLYLSFISIPPPGPADGSLLYRARTPDGREVFFTAATMRYQTLEAEKLKRLLIALTDGFLELVPKALGDEHPLTEVTIAISDRKNEVQFWNTTQQKVKDLLQKGQGPEALSILEPLVYARTPHAQAEKLLGELLYSSAKKPEAAQEAPGQQALKQLMTETVLLQWYLKRQQIAPDS